MNTIPHATVNIILTGATGMVGEGVLYACLERSEVGKVLVINRKPCGFTHPKLKEIIHPDFYDLSPIESQLTNYDACLFCAGVSSLGKKEADFFKLTYSLTLHVAETLCKLNNNMTFCYISGASTDSSEKGKIMWARIKGKTENDLMKLPFKQVYNFRPGILQPGKNNKNTLSFYKYFMWLLPITRLIAPNFICSLQELGNAMLNAVLMGYDKQVLEVKDVLILAKK